ncbi:hypothetical protein DGMP_27840 [Desulfomarina profundi]|uniref:ABC transporter ATP-binding protein n=1 Tax=Desulfomarina profundi TaxID=2772557 RepID=A0A8D5JSG5_9BACT|nr:hypothetical protein [Desulfomarina profundi]BCL62091.1 hypothetical protein DGMP_27840 [Desulfomarina profundi]
MDEYALQIENLAKEYKVSGGMFRSRKTLKAVNGVSLAIPKGSILGLVGNPAVVKRLLPR